MCQEPYSISPNDRVRLADRVANNHAFCDKDFNDDIPTHDDLSMMLSLTEVFFSRQTFYRNQMTI